jgi:hypothetical protein
MQTFTVVRTINQFLGVNTFDDLQLPVLAIVARYEGTCSYDSFIKFTGETWLQLYTGEDVET